MKYGVGTSIENYGILEELGFDYIELAGNQIAKMTDQEFAKVKETIANGPVKCCGFNAALPPEIVFCGANFDLEKAKVYAEGLCKRGNALGISAIGIGSPKSRLYQEGDSLDTAWQQVKDFLGMFTDVAKPYGITIMYESLNHTESQFGLKIREGADLVAKMGKENLKIVFDIYHMAIEKENITELKYAMPYVNHIHIAERVGEERRYPSENLRSYYKELLEEVVAYGYDKAICTEAFDGDVYEGAKRSLELLKSMIAEIKGE
ncbi:MAG: sugar phosphate isomerase/epimerase family protein [Bacillota bacterium]